MVEETPRSPRTLCWRPRLQAEKCGSKPSLTEASNGAHKRRFRMLIGLVPKEVYEQTGSVGPERERHPGCDQGIENCTSG